MRRSGKPLAEELFDRWVSTNTPSNAVELIVAIIALIDGQVTVVQTSLVGSVLSNLLLVMGFCFLAGGFNRSEQFFNTTVAQTAASLLALSVASLIVPTIFSHTPDLYSNDNITSLPPHAVAQLSRGVSIILLLIYASYLFFQLKTHTSLFNQESQKVPKKDIRVFKKKPHNTVASGILESGIPHARLRDENGDAIPIAVDTDEAASYSTDEDKKEPLLHFWVAVATLTISTVIIALCAEGLVSGIEPIKGVVSEEFIGLILLPIVGNACEHATAVTVAVKDKMDLAIGVAIGSSMQVALFLIPLLVIIGWGIGNEDMTLAFDTFQVVTLFVAVLLVNYLIGDGKSHWLEGAQLIALYVIIAVCAFCKFRYTVTEKSGKLICDSLPQWRWCYSRHGGGCAENIVSGDTKYPNLFAYPQQHAKLGYSTIEQHLLRLCLRFSLCNHFTVSRTNKQY
jgi:Ca2+:H+ antiporter